MVGAAPATGEIEVQLVDVLQESAESFVTVKAAELQAFRSDHMTTIAGFVVVRRPGFTAVPIEPGEREVPPARLGKVFYGGVFRRPWAEVHYRYYRRTLPPTLMDLEERIRRANEAYSEVEVCQDIHAAAALLAFSRSLMPENDLIAVRSPQLSKAKGRVHVDDDLIEWKGIDIITPGWGSLLEDGLLWKPQLFQGWEAALLPNGLLAYGVSVDAYVAAFRAGVAQRRLENLVEPLPGYHIEAIEVGAVREDHLPQSARAPL